MDKYFITTPIYYINDKAHIGHAYTTIAADVLARYYRQQGVEVLFSTGTDENSLKTVKAAEAAGEEIITYTEVMAKRWQNTWDSLNISYDRFIRTTEEVHKETVYALLERLEKAGDIYKGTYKGLYCVGCEEFIKETDLVDGKCPEHNQTPELVEEENYFFKLSKYQKALLEHIQANPKFIQPATRRNEVVAFIKRGLEDISISREGGKWGIPFPLNNKHVIYVWAEALVNYLTVASSAAGGAKKWWPADLHLVGKGIIKFHCIIWPAMLLSAGLELPKAVVAHGHLNVAGTKISKSLGNAIDPLELAKQYGTDAFRYLLLRDTPFGQDGDFSLERIEAQYNADLANELGNLTQRVAAMVVKYLGGTLSKIPTHSHDVAAYHEAMRSHRFDKALEEVWLLVKGLNQYIEEEKPWQIAKTDVEHVSEILAYLVSNLIQISELLVPFLPETADKIKQTFAGNKVDQTIGILFPKHETEA